MSSQGKSAMDEFMIVKYTERLERSKNECNIHEQVQLYLLRGLQYKKIGRIDEFLKDMDSGMKCCEGTLMKNGIECTGDKWEKMKKFVHLQAELYLEQEDWEKADVPMTRLCEVDKTAFYSDLDTMFLNGKIEMMRKDYPSARRSFFVVTLEAKKCGGNESIFKEANYLMEKCNKAILNKLKNNKGRVDENLKHDERGKEEQINRNIGKGEERLYGSIFMHVSSIRAKRKKYKI